MSSLKTIISDLKNNPKLAVELQALVAKIVDEKRFEWPFDETIVYDGLTNLGVLEVNETTVYVRPSDYLAYGFLEFYQMELVDLKAATKFEHTLRKQLGTPILTTELFRITERISRLWLKSKYLDEGNNLILFSAGAKSAKRFIGIFCEILPELSLSAADLYTHFRQFSGEQIHLPPLIQALELHLQEHTEVAFELYEYTREHSFEGDIHLLMTTLSGLNRQDWVKFLPKLESLIKQPENQILGLSVLFRAQILTDDQANLYLDLALSCDQSNEDVRSNIANVLLQVLRFPLALKPDTVSRVFTLLNDLAQSKSANVQKAVSGVIYLIDDFEVKRFAVFKTLLRNSSLESTLRTGDSNTVDTLLSSSFRGPDYWFAVFDELVEQNSLSFKNADFTGSLRDLLSDYGERSMSFLLARLIHRQSETRQAADQILNFIDNQAPQLRFSEEELRRLSPLQQYRLWLMVDKPHRQPSFTLPLLLPLFDSTDALLLELISCQLELNSENYMGQVLETLDAICNPENEQHQQVRQRVNAHFDQFLEYRQRKSLVNELNPLLTQRTLFQQFDDLRRMSWSEEMHERVHKDSLASLFKHVLLSKGGGWRNSKTGITSQLGHIQTKVSLPRYYFIRPHEMDFDVKINSDSEDWTNDIDLFTWITQK